MLYNKTPRCWYDSKKLEYHGLDMQLVKAKNAHRILLGKYVEHDDLEGRKQTEKSPPWGTMAGLDRNRHYCHYAMADKLT
jgi:hypothetical protein